MLTHRGTTGLYKHVFDTKYKKICDLSYSLAQMSTYHMAKETESEASEVENIINMIERYPNLQFLSTTPILTHFRQDNYSLFHICSQSYSTTRFMRGCYCEISCLFQSHKCTMQDLSLHGSNISTFWKFRWFQYIVWKKV